MCGGEEGVKVLKKLIMEKIGGKKLTEGRIKKEEGRKDKKRKKEAIFHFHKIQLVVYYQCCVLIG